MKKYLFIGLAVLIATNLVVLSGVAYNRMGEPTAQLTLTERELTLPYNSAVKKENSGISLSINWRTPTTADESDYPYNSRRLEITRDELFALGFDQPDVENNSWIESRQLYWALEFDGDLHDAEVKKATAKYQAALLAYEAQPEDMTRARKVQANNNLARITASNSRLFFIEASQDYDILATRYEGRDNVLIVRGLARADYNGDKQSYSLSLGRLLIPKIMVPLQHSEVFLDLKKRPGQEVTTPRYSVDIKWGSRLEPWISGAKRLTD